MKPSKTVQVVGEGGWRGEVEDASQLGHEARVAIRQADGRRVLVPANVLEARDDGTYYLPLRADQLQGNGQEPAGEALVVPVVEEQLDVRKRAVRRGGVRVRKRAYQQEQVVDEPLWQEDVQVERVRIDRPIDAPTPVRQEGDTLIVPVFEEVLVVEKRLMLREELHITRQRKQVREVRRVSLRGEEAFVQPMEPDETEPE
jgi:uncharacterized protein (TIGR02271 family)